MRTNDRERLLTKRATGIFDSALSRFSAHRTHTCAQAAIELGQSFLQVAPLLRHFMWQAHHHRINLVFSLSSSWIYLNMLTNLTSAWSHREDFFIAFWTFDTFLQIYIFLVKEPHFTSLMLASHTLYLKCSQLHLSLSTFFPKRGMSRPEAKSGALKITLDDSSAYASCKLRNFIKINICDGHLATCIYLLYAWIHHCWALRICAWAESGCANQEKSCIMRHKKKVAAIFPQN